MTSDRLEDTLRHALRDRVAHVSESTLPPVRDLHGGAGRADRSGNRPGGPRRGASRVALGTLVAVAIVAVAVIGVLTLTRTPHDDVPAGGSAAPNGSWLLTGLQVDGGGVTVPATPPVILTFTDGSLVVADGVNATTIDVSADGTVLTARFHGSTLALDGSDDPARVATLRALDSIAPPTSQTATRSTYTVRGDVLTLDTGTAQLTLTRAAAATAADDGAPSGTPSPTASFGASTDPSSGPSSSLSPS